MKNNWQIKKIEDILDKVKNTKKVPKKKFLISGEYPIISQEVGLINGYWDNEDDLFKIKKPIVVFGDHTQIRKYVDFDFILGADGVKILQPNDDIDSRYFYYFLEGLELKQLGYARHFKLVKESNISYPSIPEQKRIVKVLDEMFVGIDKVKENVERNLQNARELFESYLQMIFVDGNENNWEEEVIGDLFINKVEKKEAREKLDEDDMVSSVPMKDLKILQKDFPKTTDRKMKDVIKGYTYFADEDVLMAKITPSFENGKLGIARNLTNGIGFGSSEFIVFRSNGTMIPDYLFYFLSQSYLRRELKPLMTGTSGHKRVPLNILNEYLIVFPKSKTEQKSIVKKLDALSEQTKKLENIYQKKLGDLEELRKSVLKKAFNGEL